MPQMTNEHDDLRDVPESLVGFMEARGWALTQKAAVEASEELKGQALDDALEDADLPKSGSADDKRARYAEWLAAQQDTEQDPANAEEQQS